MYVPPGEPKPNRSRSRSRSRSQAEAEAETEAEAEANERIRSHRRSRPWERFARGFQEVLDCFFLRSRQQQSRLNPTKNSRTAMVKHSRSGLLLVPGVPQRPPLTAAGEATSAAEQEDDWGWFEDLDPVDEDDLHSAVAAAQHLEPSCRRHCPAPTTAAAASGDGAIGTTLPKEEEVTIGDKPSVPVRPNDEDALHQCVAHAFKPQRSRSDELTHPPKLLATSSFLDAVQTRSWVVVGGDDGAFKPRRSRSDRLAHPLKLLATGSFLDDDQTRSWIVVGGDGGSFAPAITRHMDDTAAAHPDVVVAFCERALRVSLERNGNSEATTIAVASDPVLTRHPLVCGAPAVGRSATAVIRCVGGDGGASGGGGPPAVIGAVCVFSSAGGAPSGVGGAAASGGAAAGGSSAGNHLGSSAATSGTTTGSTTDDLLLIARDVARMRSRSRSRRPP